VRRGGALGQHDIASAQVLQEGNWRIQHSVESRCSLACNAGSGTVQTILMAERNPTEGTRTTRLSIHWCNLLTQCRMPWPCGCSIATANSTAVSPPTTLSHTSGQDKQAVGKSATHPVQDALAVQVLHGHSNLQRSQPIVQP
jgi:hypothetical protein